MRRDDPPSVGGGPAAPAAEAGAGVSWDAAAPAGDVAGGDVALLTDLYELTMLQAYWRERMDAEAVFSLHVRKLPPERNYLLACGVEDALRQLAALRFTRPALDYLGTLGLFRDEFLDWLGRLRFTGDVYAVPEGTPVFPPAPLLEVVAPLPEAQLAETLVLNRIHFQTVLASKAARVVRAAAGRPVVDFALRRMPGIDAGVTGARAFYVAGVASTSDVLAGARYGIPVAGTMAHSYVQAHDDELEAFRRFASLYPETTLLVDTYDTLRGVDAVIRLAAELGDAFRVRAIRLDSGDLAELARESRRRLDEAGLTGVRIFASGGLDEYAIAALVRSGAPIDAFGVGTRMGVSSDAPALDGMAYKLTEYAGRGRTKLSTGKFVYPGRKQVWRVEEG
ncbi:MAG: nicotinate phosphoribosyltransferase, partial [Gemmatimonadetes bacterium]|nr:nicotinate phosphoribosyltransferase [Gemmatimonadota bacterium]